jgi:hypothetical protein
MSGMKGLFLFLTVLFCGAIISNISVAAQPLLTYDTSVPANLSTHESRYLFVNLTSNETLTDCWLY